MLQNFIMCPFKRVFVCFYKAKLQEGIGRGAQGGVLLREPNLRILFKKTRLYVTFGATTQNSEQSG